MGTLANSKDPGEMLQDVAFYQGLHCSLFGNPNNMYNEPSKVLGIKSEGRALQYTKG